MISKDLAVIRAIDAMRRTLATYLPAKLEEYEADEPGLPLPEPTAFRLALSPEAMEEAIQNHSVVAFIFQSAESETTSKNSGSALNAEQVQSTFIEVRIAYQMGLQAPYTPETWGTQLTSQDILARRGYYYVAGVIDTVHRKLCCTSDGAVTDVRFVDSDFAGAIFQTINQKYHGVASVVFELRQDVTVPYCE